MNHPVSDPANHPGDRPVTHSAHGGTADGWSSASWHEANQRYLMAAIAQVRVALEQYTHAAEPQAIETQSPPVPISNLSPPPALDVLCAEFNLSPFERSLLLLCLGVELDPQIAALCAADNPTHRYATFSLALAALPEAHWSAMAPAAPLRYWHLIQVNQAETLTSSPLRIDERTLNYLIGVTYLDDRLHSLVHPLLPPPALPFSYRAQAERIVQHWAQPASMPPIVQLGGNASGGKTSLAAASCSALGLRLYGLNVADLPTTATEREILIRLWERETIFSRCALLIDGDGYGDEPASVRTIQRFVEQMQGYVFVTHSTLLHLRKRSVVYLAVNRPPLDEQRALWKNALGDLAHHLNGHLDRAIAQFSLDLESIHTAAQTLREAIASSPIESQPPNQPEEPTPTDLTSLAPLFWDACRTQGRPTLENLAQRLESAVTWDDLILPPEQLQTLHEVAAHVRQRGKVYDTWGFASRSGRGLGISALFAGPSGTGKTLAAEVLANDLHLDLYQIDLSQIVSKYIGETEKNLRQIFDAAEHSGAILLFDEADALFGKRSEVKDSHDRYANIEVSYLLQRMEAYRGLAILTTNQRQALDTAFLRRLRFVITFALPGVAQRAQIWERIFPPDTPTEGLDIAKLARLNLSGGNIRNISLNAAFLAAEMNQPVRMSHLLRGVQSEYAKLEKPLTATEIGGWV